MRFSHVMPDGSLAIIYLSERYAVDSDEAAYFLLKTCFELHRSEFETPTMINGVRRFSMHFDDYTGPRDWVTRALPDAEVLPDRSRRNAWRERTIQGRREIFVDETIPREPQ